jgi:peptidoglycan/LPS O-acetylase OafA/YrhL
MFAVALPATAVLAVLSWHLVESPALKLKDRLKAPAAQPDPRILSTTQR